MYNIEDKTRVSFYLDNSLLKQADMLVKSENFKSRNEFVSKAIKSYIADLQLSNSNNEFTEKLSAAISKATMDSTIQVSKGLFRYAVTAEIIIKMLSEVTDFSKEDIANLRKDAVNNVRRTRGKINLVDTITHTQVKEFE